MTDGLALFMLALIALHSALVVVWLGVVWWLKR